MLRERLTYSLFTDRGQDTGDRGDGVMIGSP